MRTRSSLSRANKKRHFNDIYISVNLNASSIIRQITVEFSMCSIFWPDYFLIQLFISVTMSVMRKTFLSEELNIRMQVWGMGRVNFLFPYISALPRDPIFFFITIVLSHEFAVARSSIFVGNQWVRARAGEGVRKAVQQGSGAETQKYFYKLDEEQPLRALPYPFFWKKKLLEERRRKGENPFPVVLHS